MKRGVIFYVTEGKEQIHEWLDLRAEQTLLQADALSLAVSESDIAYNWWKMTARGVQEILCMKAAYNRLLGTFEPHGIPLRLCG